jgi:hypothetical protein
MTERNAGVSRRHFLKGAGGASIAAISARGAYAALEGLGLVAPARADAATVRRKQEQYLIESLEAILDNGVTVIIPPIYNDVVTARLAARSWTAAALKSAQSRLENALQTVESPYPATAAGLTIVVGWGLPYFRTYVPRPWAANAPVDLPLTQTAGSTQYAILDAIAFPSDPPGVVLEQNHVAFKLRSDSQAVLQSIEHALFEDTASKAYVGDLFELTSKRIGFVGRGFGTPSVGKKLAAQNGVPGADLIPDNAQLMLGFTSTQPAALGPSNIVSFETLPGVTNQWPSGYFAAGCAMHLSHLVLDLQAWYGGFDYAGRVARMFSPHTPVPAPETVTIPNGPGEVSTRAQLMDDAAKGQLGHNATLQQASRLGQDVKDNYGRIWTKGTAVPIREDFNTIDNPFAWPVAAGTPAAAGLHFAVFTPASRLFHAARRAMDGLLPDGTDLRGTITDAQNGINAIMQATHRQNFVVPPRRHRSFPLAELV